MEIEDIVRALRSDRIRITDHADVEALADDLSFDEIAHRVVHGAILEDDPDDKPYSSCLICGDTGSGDPVQYSGVQSGHGVHGPDHDVSSRPGSLDRLAYEEGEVTPFKKCPMCGGEVVRKRTEKLLRGGVNLSTVTVEAEVCLHCGERMYSADTIRSFAHIRSRLELQEVEEFEPIGTSFRVPVRSSAG